MCFFPKKVKFYIFKNLINLIILGVCQTTMAMKLLPIYAPSYTHQPIFSLPIDECTYLMKEKCIFESMVNNTKRYYIKRNISYNTIKERLFLLKSHETATSPTEFGLILNNWEKAYIDTAPVNKHYFGIENIIFSYYNQTHYHTWTMRKMLWDYNHMTNKNMAPLLGKNYKNERRTTFNALQISSELLKKGLQNKRRCSVLISQQHKELQQYYGPIRKFLNLFENQTTKELTLPNTDFYFTNDSSLASNNRIYIGLKDPNQILDVCAVLDNEKFINGYKVTGSKYWENRRNTFVIYTPKTHNELIEMAISIYQKLINKNFDPIGDISGLMCRQIRPGISIAPDIGQDGWQVFISKIMLQYMLKMQTSNTIYDFLTTQHFKHLGTTLENTVFEFPTAMIGKKYSIKNLHYIDFLDVEMSNPNIRKLFSNDMYNKYKSYLNDLKSVIGITAFTRLEDIITSDIKGTFDSQIENLENIISLGIETTILVQQNYIRTTVNTIDNRLRQHNSPNYYSWLIEQRSMLIKGLSTMNMGEVNYYYRQAKKLTLPGND